MCLLVFIFPLSSDDCMKGIILFMIELHMLKEEQEQNGAHRPQNTKDQSLLSLWVRYFFRVFYLDFKSSITLRLFPSREKILLQRAQRKHQFLDNSSFEESKSSLAQTFYRLANLKIRNSQSLKLKKSSYSVFEQLQTEGVCSQ